MAPIRDDLNLALADVQARDPRLAVYSTVTGKEEEGSFFKGSYWWLNVRQQVAFAKTLHNLFAESKSEGRDMLLLEVGTRPVLSTYLQEGLAESGVPGLIAHSLHPKQKDDFAYLRRNLGQLLTAGQQIRWEAFLQPCSPIKLPPYVWDHQRYWLESKESQSYRLVPSQKLGIFLARRAI